MSWRFLWESLSYSKKYLFYPSFNEIYCFSNGHGLTVMKETVPGFGDRLTGAGRVNVFHNDNHDVSARASITRNMPNFPNVPNFNTVGGGVDYMYKYVYFCTVRLTSSILH